MRRPEAVGAMRAAASRVASPELRRCVAAAAREIERGKETASSTEPGGLLDAVMKAIDAVVADATNAADAVARADAVAAAEAVAWALAWMTRPKRSAGSAGALLERLVRHAEGALPALASGDTSAARFLLVLGRLFRDVEACRRFGDDAVSAIEREIITLVPTGGAVRQTGSAAIARTVVGWASFRAAAEATGGPAWSERTEDAFVSSLDTAVRLLDASGGRQSASGKKASGRKESLDARTILDAARRLGGRPLAITAKRMAGRESPAEGLSRDVRHAEERMAILRSGWRRRDVRVLVDARGDDMYLEIAAGGRLFVEGPWAFEVRVEGVPVAPEGPWEDSCHESDDDATFQEWTLPLSRGLRLERQIVLAPRDRVLLLADSIVPAAEGARAAGAGHPAVAAAVDYRGSFTVAEGVGTDPADETREVVGHDTETRFLAVPLALAEWSAAAADGRFVGDGSRLVLEQRSPVARLHAPTWFDLEPARIGAPLTWRQLTVADTRQNLPAHRACGYRIQAGRKQWLVYRALDAVRNRSVLGCNLSCEFLLGRIGREGIVERLIEIQ